MARGGEMEGHLVCRDGHGLKRFLAFHDGLQLFWNEKWNFLVLQSDLCIPGLEVT